MYGLWYQLNRVDVKHFPVEMVGDFLERYASCKEQRQGKQQRLLDDAFLSVVHDDPPEVLRRKALAGLLCGLKARAFFRLSTELSVFPCFS